MDEQQIGQEIGHLNAEYDELFKEVEELYKEVPEATGDPGAYYDMMRMIAAKEGRMERIGDRLAQLYRLREQF